MSFTWTPESARIARPRTGCTSTRACGSPRFTSSVRAERGGSGELHIAQAELPPQLLRPLLVAVALVGATQSSQCSGPIVKRAGQRRSRLHRFEQLHGPVEVGDRGLKVRLLLAQVSPAATPERLSLAVAIAHAAGAH